MKTCKRMLIAAAIMMLAFMMFGCSKNADARQPESIIFGASDSSENTSLSSDLTKPQEDTSAVSTGFPATQEDTSTVSTEFPTTEEILSCLDAEENRMYWTATMPELSGTIDVLTVKTLSEEAVVSELLEKLKGKYSVAEDAEETEITEINLIPLDAGTDVEAVLKALSQLTGINYTEIEPEEFYAAQYVPVWNGYAVDAEGIAYGGERAGDVVTGSYVAIKDDGEITICRPLLLVGTAKTLDTADLITPDMVEMICEANYESDMGGACVTIITDLSLGYYYSDTEEALLPAWRIKKTFYRSQTGHNKSVLMDAETGELLRG